MMAGSEKFGTTVSIKGQVSLPAAMRKRRNWGVGTRLQVEDTPHGVLLKPVPAFTPTQPEDVFGTLPHNGGPKTLEQMDAGVLAEAQRRDASD